MNYSGNLDDDVYDWVEKRGLQFTGNCTSEILTISKKWDLFATRFVFPFYFVLGSFCNTLNLIVLLSMPGEMTVANVLFAGVALADLGLLLTMATNIIGAWPIFYMRNTFRWFYYNSHFITLMLSNTFLCISSWMVCAVSIERFLHISNPLRTVRHHSHWRVFVTVAAIVAGSLLLNLYHLVEYRYGFAFICDNQTLFGLHHSIFSVALQQAENIHPLLIKYVNTNKWMQIFLAVLLPLTLITVLYVRIIYLLRQNTGWLKTFRAKEEAAGAAKGAALRSTSLELHGKRDRKISIMSAVIITFYLLTHAPSALPFLIELFGMDFPVWMKTFGNTIIIYWLLCGKVMNFFLFCLSSQAFRQRVVASFEAKEDKIRRRLGLRPREKKKSSTVSACVSRSTTVRLRPPSDHYTTTEYMETEDYLLEDTV